MKKIEKFIKLNWLTLSIIAFLVLFGKKIWNLIFNSRSEDDLKTANIDILTRCEIYLANYGLDYSKVQIMAETIGGELYGAMTGVWTNKDILRKYLTGENLIEFNGKLLTEDPGALASILILGYGKKTLSGSVPIISTFFPEPELCLPFALMSELDILDFSLRSDINEFFKTLQITI